MGTERARTFLTFRQGEVVYALPVAAVESVVEKPRVTKLPGHSAVKGVFNLRGSPVALGDLREMLEGGASDLERSGAVIVLNFGLPGGFRARFGAFADGVDEVVELEAEPANERLAGLGSSRAVTEVARHNEDFALLVDPVALAVEMGVDALAHQAAEAS
ncbi:MAG: chemotaxis protein CheW [Spirochaetales bacterium]|nr:chemotaxis protein CheW [Spirochaetales bacterium]